ncbi:hypothetical protein JYJ95_37990 [Corallococcus exiguus]|uniref:phage tail assembly chaperone n=1 Tax=Corallococcus exiguus TaxID=83462 RepID=UPI001A8FBCEB|nr:hypothetical protein [Corallococcus exiguus]MBN8472329.1 hypothetical protein [Corallococcus exiguus]
MQTQKEVTIGGKRILLGKLTPRASVGLLLELARAGLAQALESVFKGLRGGMTKEQALFALGGTLGALVDRLSPAEFEKLAEKALACSTFNGTPVWPQVDAILAGPFEVLTLVYEALRWQFEDFSSALGVKLSPPPGA